MSLSTRFADAWFRQYDEPTDGFVDSAGFMSRIPLRLESSNVFLYGTVDAEKMWKEFEDEAFVPVLVGGKAVLNIWFNNFTDTDCGGEYWETWYNTFVTPKGEPQLELPFETPFSMLIQDPRSLVYLQRVICGDTPRNPGAALKAITGGRSVFGFPKHPMPATVRYAYTQEGKNVEFDASHGGKDAVSLRLRVPEADDGAVSLPFEIKSGPDVCIGGPRLGGTHKGDNGAHQVRYGQAFKCTQHLKPWDSKMDSITFGGDSHYAAPIKRWDFEPVLKAHTTDMKIAAFKPVNWISGSEAAAIVKDHEQKIAAGIMAGAL
ncbi:unnamed protein product [Polarella glacialis]|uniref:Uncharacterized protein n=1 Tax=Polarella glacialis TaxID=89957 RepID=A0A813KLV9_POLGL|nr:unnamed protein product [Polarella glacialis]CAE8704738.1 unnamed protein product [Polarella glacialis]